jgi:hypothetical protein
MVDQPLLGQSVTVCVDPEPTPVVIVSPLLRYRLGPHISERLIAATRLGMDGMAHGLTWGGSFASQPSCPWPPVCLPLAGLFLAAALSGAAIEGVTGAIYGFLSADPRLTPGMKVAVSQAQISDALERYVHAGLTNLPPFKVVRCPFPLDQAQSVFLRALHKSSVNTMVALKIGKMAFVGIDDNGIHRLVIQTNASLISGKDLVQMVTWDWNYVSAGHTLEEWQTDGARHFREELEKVYESVTSKVETELTKWRTRVVKGAT